MKTKKISSSRKGSQYKSITHSPRIGILLLLSSLSVRSSVRLSSWADEYPIEQIAIDVPLICVEPIRFSNRAAAAPLLSTEA